jgi:hypothetical protein
LANQLLLPPTIIEATSNGNGVPQLAVITNIEFPNDQSTVPEIIDVEPRTPLLLD